MFGNTCLTRSKINQYVYSEDPCTVEENRLRYNAESEGINQSGKEHYANDSKAMPPLSCPFSLWILDRWTMFTWRDTHHDTF